VGHDATVTLSFRVAPDKVDALEKLSRATDRPKSWLLERALDDYLLDQAWQIGAIEEGMKAAEGGDVISHAEVREWLMTWGKQEEREPPA
jgi:predicted transcriptional regulator